MDTHRRRFDSGKSQEGTTAAENSEMKERRRD
jgi:hypothetical protein